MKTYSLKKSEIVKKWWLADADGKTLGRFASEIAKVLRGKHKVEFSPHLDMGDVVVVINAEKISLSGNKENSKKYFSHSGYPGSVKEISVREMRTKKPENIVINAVKGMIPHNRLGRAILSHLKVYSGSEHPHQAQKPMDLIF